jgi:hypothetical protein
MRAQAVSKEALARGDKAMQERKPVEPGAKVYVATLPPLANSGKNLNVLQFNSQLGTALIGTTAKPGPDVYAAVNGRLIDSWHPTEAALKDVGRAWAQRIAKEFPRLGVQQ